MRTRRITFPDTPNSGFYIRPFGKLIIIVPFGSVHIFNYLYLIDREVTKLVKKLDLPNPEIFIDILPVAGNRDKTLFKVNFHKESGKIDWSAYKELSIEEAPKHVLEAIRTIYKKNRKTITKYLMPSERKRFEAVLLT